MKPLVSIIMGSTSDLPVMEKAEPEEQDVEIEGEETAESGKQPSLFDQA